MLPAASAFRQARKGNRFSIVPPILNVEVLEFLETQGE
jgi:hypothetical protein